mmetsp:Transcript_2501/g.5974  ORF Transcript_2501/g.5974 Transcript_2501/m.5974 type:complete len:111 (-) Transcript_2501:78-410(-)
MGLNGRLEAGEQVLAEKAWIDDPLRTLEVSHVFGRRGVTVSEDSPLEPQRRGRAASRAEGVEACGSTAFFASNSAATVRALGFHRLVPSLTIGKRPGKVTCFHLVTPAIS